MFLKASFPRRSPNIVRHARCTSKLDSERTFSELIAEMCFIKLTLSCGHELAIFKSF